MLGRRIICKASASGAPVSITGRTLNAMGAGTVTEVYQLTNTGLARQVENGVPSTLETWLLSGAVADYEVRVTDLDGNLTSGTTGSWLGLGTTREWGITESTSGASVTTHLTVEIRLAASPFTVLDTETVTLGVFVF